MEEERKEWQFNKGTELRFEVENSASVTLKLLNGTAEIFGTELCVDQELRFTGRKVAVFTWQGCTVELRGNPSVVYVAEETPNTLYLNTHLALQSMRETAAKNPPSRGPRVMVVGPTDAGKTSLCKMFLSYALKQGEHPMYVDLDPEEGSITIPGCLTATTLSRGIDIEEGFGMSATTAPSMGGSATTPLVYYYGHASVAENPKHYKILVDKLAESVNLRMNEDADAASSGFVIDTAGQIDSLGHDLLMHAICAFDVNIVLVMGHERLFAELSRPLRNLRTADGANIKILKLPKSGGVVERDKSFRRAVSNRKIKEYFYGDPRCVLSPFSSIIAFKDFKVYRFGQGSLAPSSALPIGEDRKVDETQIVSVDSMDVLLHSILAVVEAEDEEDLAKKPSLGFIYVSEIDSVKGKLTILTPCPGRLPRRVLIMGSFKWSDA